MVSHKGWGDIMTKLDKLFSDIVNNPKDVRFEDIDKVLKYYGFECIFS